MTVLPSWPGSEGPSLTFPLHKPTQSLASCLLSQSSLGLSSLELLQMLVLLPGTPPSACHLFLQGSIYTEMTCPPSAVPCAGSLTKSHLYLLLLMVAEHMPSLQGNGIGVFHFSSSSPGSEVLGAFLLRICMWACMNK